MACNCNEEPKCYNINMGCVTPIVANADNYYTKSEVDEKIDDIIISGGGITSGEVQSMIDESIADKADKSEIPTIPTNVSAFINDVPYLTEHQDLSNYALKSDLTPISSGLSALNDEVDDLSTAMENKADKSEIPSLNGYATEQYVQNYTYDKAAIDEKVAGGGTFDPTQYYNKTQANALLAEKADTATTYSKVEVNNLLSSKADATALNDYYNKTQTDALLNDKLDATAYTPTDLSNYYTKQETSGASEISTALSAKLDATAYTPTDLSNYYTKDETSGKTQLSTAFNSKQNALSATSGISISNNEISTRIGNGLRYTANGELEVNATNAIASGNTQVPLSYVVHNYINNNCVLKSKIWCGTQAQYDAITTKDAETLYLIHS